MSRVKKLATFLCLLLTGLPAFAEGEAHGISASPETLLHIGPLPITNSMVTSWVVAIALVILIRLAVGKPQLVPTRGQAMVENLVQGVLDLITPIVGKKVAKPAFPLLVGLFTFILIQNWSGLIPGVGTVFMRSHITGESRSPAGSISSCVTRGPPSCSRIFSATRRTSAIFPAPFIIRCFSCSSRWASSR
jgi:F-type H+-transporting ATPase subunit a